MQVYIRGTRSCPCNYWRRQVSCWHLSTWLLWTKMQIFTNLGDVSVIWICLLTILELKMIHLYNLTCFNTLLQPSDNFSCHLLKLSDSWVCKMLEESFHFLIQTIPEYSDVIVWLNLYGCLNTMFSQHN